MTVPVVEGQAWQGGQQGASVTHQIANGTNSRHHIFIHVCLYGGNVNNNIRTPAGYTSLIGDAGSNVQWKIFYKHAEDNEPDPIITWYEPGDFGGNTNWAITSMSIAFVDPITPIQSQREDEGDDPETNSNVQSKELITNLPDSLALGFAAIHSSGDGIRLVHDNGASPGWVQRYIKQSDSGGQAVASCQATKPMPAVGDTGRATWGGTNISGWGSTIILNGGPGGRRIFIS